MKSYDLSYVFAGLSYIPLVGVLFGLLAILIGFSEKNKKAALIGAGGIFFTFAIYGSLFYFGFVQKTGPFAEMKKELSKEILTQNSGYLELYYKKHGKYPASLSDLDADGYTVFPADHYMKPFHYNVSEDGQSYELKSLGPDGELNTSDDISPNQ